MLKGLGYARKEHNDRSLYFFNKTYQNSVAQEDYFSMAKSADRVATCYWVAEKFDASRKWYDVSINHHQQSNDSIKICEPYLGIGNILVLDEFIWSRS